MESPQNEIAVGFQRRLVADNPSLIRSVCLVCGAAIVGSVMKHLREDEAEHRKDCPVGLASA